MLLLNKLLICKTKFIIVFSLVKINAFIAGKLFMLKCFKKLYILLPMLVMFSKSALACWCDDSKKIAMSFDESFKDASLVFIGEVEEMTWKGMPTSKTLVGKDGLRIDVSDYVDPSSPEQTFDPKVSNSMIGYKTLLKVDKVWKDDANRVIQNKTYIQSTNGGWCGFQFEKGKRYLVYARDGGHKETVPVASICSRTRPYEYGTDDIKILEQLKK